MKKNFNRALMLTAAALTLSAAAAYGQTKVTGEIPFAFRTARGVQPAGVYDLISISPNREMLALRSVATLKAVPLGIGAPEGSSSARSYEARPRLVFHCSDANGCVLYAAFIDDGRGWSYRAPHVKPSEERVAVVYLGRAAGGQ